MEDSRGSGRVRFRDVLAQVIGLLVLEGRVSYRALALQFDLDDESLDTPFSQGAASGSPQGGQSPRPGGI